MILITHKGEQLRQEGDVRRCCMCCASGTHPRTCDRLFTIDNTNKKCGRLIERELKIMSTTFLTGFIDLSTNIIISMPIFEETNMIFLYLKIL